MSLLLREKDAGRPASCDLHQGKKDTPAKSNELARRRQTPESSGPPAPISSLPRPAVALRSTFSPKFPRGQLLAGSLSISRTAALGTGSSCVCLVAILEGGVHRKPLLETAAREAAPPGNSCTLDLPCRGAHSAGPAPPPKHMSDSGCWPGRRHRPTWQRHGLRACSCVRACACAGVPVLAPL